MNNLDNLTKEELLRRVQLLEKENMLLKEQVRLLTDQAFHDNLTGLLNRNCLNYNDKYGSAIMMDIDYFKNINDEYGHLIGDKTLEEIGHIVLNSVSSDDKAVRYGGDEFLILIKSDDEEYTKEVVSKIQEGVKNMNLNINVSLSFGYCIGNNYSLNESILYADEALLASKEAGRNRCTKFDRVGMFQNR